MSATYRNRPPGPVKGFTLIEVLVSIVILSLGLLGMVSLQAASLKVNNEARLQATAVQLADEMSDLMRANKEEALKSTGNIYRVNFTGALPAISSNCFTADCLTPAELAASDVAEWLRRVDSQLPGAQVAICEDSAPFDAAGKPQWVCTNSGGVTAIKIGWTRGSLNRSATNATPFDLASIAPAVIVQTSPGAR